MDLAKGGSVNINQILDLIGAQVTVQNEQGQSQVYLSPFTNDPIAMALYMPMLMEYLTAQETPVLPGRLNIMDCAPELIWGLPGITDEQKQAIIDARSDGTESDNRKYETWPLVEGIISMAEMRSLSPLICAGGDVFRAQIVGYFEGATASSRLEVVIDATTAAPRQVMWRDLTHLGRGYDVGVLGVRSVDGIQTLQQQ
jgi:hypothetical protein